MRYVVPGWSAGRVPDGSQATLSTPCHEEIPTQTTATIQIRSSARIASRIRRGRNQRAFGRGTPGVGAIRPGEGVAVRVGGRVPPPRAPGGGIVGMTWVASPPAEPP